MRRMKHIFTMMEQSCQKDLKKVMLVYIIAGIAIALMIFFHSMSGWTYIAILATGILSLVVIETRRIYHQVVNGNRNRMLLLPVKRMMFFWSEVLYCTSCIMGLFFSMALVWMMLLVYVKHATVYDFMMVSWSNDIMKMIFPSQPYLIITWILFSIALGLECVVEALDFGLKQGKLSRAMVKLIFWFYIIFSDMFIDVRLWISVPYVLIIIGIDLSEGRKLMHAEKKETS